MNCIKKIYIYFTFVISNYTYFQTKAAFKSTISQLDSIKYATLNILNKIFVKDEKAYAIGEEFKSLATDIFSADIQNVNFANSICAASTINEWVS